MTADVETELYPLLARGYRLIESSFDPKHFGNIVLLLTSDNVQLRILRERSQWFADIARNEDGAEQFDAHIVFRALGLEPSPGGRESLRSVAQLLASTADQWEPLFDFSRYEGSQKLFRETKIAFSRERFGYPP